ncbi:MAG: ATP-binding protein [Verrucomicrobiaceae bacterium]|nr:ATP-binding protein [Verrucomicrobiaceae bacterium]
MRNIYKADLNMLAKVSSDIECFCQAKSVPQRDEYALNLSAEELFTNSVMYGYKGDSNNSVQIDLSIENDCVKMVISDSAPMFNPLEQVEKPDIQSNVDDRAVGGLGVFFVRSNMTDVSYVYEDSRNVITMYRKISK